MFGKCGAALPGRPALWLQPAHGFLKEAAHTGALKLAAQKRPPSTAHSLSGPLRPPVVFASV